MITNGYATLDDLKHSARLNIESSDSGYDDMLEGVIETVSRMIDDRTNRRFYSDSDEVARYYMAENTNQVFVDDIASPSSDVTVEIDQNQDGVIDTTLDASDFVLEPYNAEVLGVPYQKIVISQPVHALFPKGVIRGVKVTAKWGWASVPKPIQQACLLQSERLFKRFATPLGSESMTALGRMTLTIPNLDPDVEMLIGRYIKPVFG